MADLRGSSPLLVVSRVGYAFGPAESARPVLSAVDLTVPRGQLVVITGPSGSGKTTLLTLIGGLRSLQTGSIRLEGTELAGLGAAGKVALRRRVGFIFQDHNLFESLTAAQNVAMATSLHPEVAAGAPLQILGELGLAGLEHRKPRELSSGQRQRVAIARALATNPPLVLADEPTAALDRQTGAGVVGLLRRRADETGAAVLLVTHDSRMFALADRLISLVDGRLEADLDVKLLTLLCTQLQRSGRFAGLSPAELAQLARTLTMRELAPGETLVGSGLIVAGEARDEPGAILGPGQTFGVTALLKNGSPDSIRALTPLRVGIIDQKSFRDLRAQPRDVDNHFLSQVFHSLIP